MKQAIVRLIVLIIALVNQGLILAGYNPLPFSEEEIFKFVSAVASVVAVLWAWYKNNSITKEAQKADEYMRDLKAKGDR